MKITATPPGCLSFLATLLIVGAIAELLYRASPTAGYGFVLLVILGYMASGGNLKAVTDFVNTFMPTQPASGRHNEG